MESGLLVLAALPLTAVTWMWAGLKSSLLPWFTGCAAIMGLALAIGPLLVRWTLSPPRPSLYRWWIRDAFFWAGLGLLVYLGLQWWNAGRALYFDVELRTWMYAAPRHPSLPWAFERNDAAQMLHWFFPAWVLGLVMRSPFMTRLGVSRLTLSLVYGAGALALFGLVQFASHTRMIYWTTPMESAFFASFAYANHAAAFFVMMGAVTAGLLFRDTFGPFRERRRKRLGCLVAVFILCLVGANLSLSRAGVILSWALASFVALFGLSRGWRLLTPAARVRLTAVVLAVVGVFYFAVSGFGNKEIRREFAVRKAPLHQLVPALAGVNLDLGPRPEMLHVAWLMWKDHPWLGVGGWGYRYLSAFYVPKAQWQVLRRRDSGRANVHNDPMQFLLEFGIAGCALLAAALAALLAPLFRKTVARGAVLALTGAGLALVVAFSLIDLPFRCPAILWTWVTVLAALPKLCMNRDPWSSPRPS